MEEFRLRSEDIYKEAVLDSSDISEWNRDLIRVRSDTMFQRNKQEKKVDLKDFTIKSVIGRGSFGKVFLVQKVEDNAVYAMKSLRKDVILDFNQIESTLLERDILLKANHPFLVGMEYVFQTD
jgi:serine/threonine protein kinase